MTLRLIHRDDRMVAVDKPGGILVHRTSEAPDRTVVLQMLRDQIGHRVHPVHRLDRAASGVLLFTLSPDAVDPLQTAMAAPDARKRYVALVRGEIEPTGRIDRPLTDDRGIRRECASHWRRREVIRGFSLVEVRIETGRRHQIRRHLAHLAHQIVGDTTYGKGRINGWLREAYGLPRLFLHAERLEFTNPFTDERLDLVAPLAGDLSAFLERFREEKEVEE